VTEHTTCVVVGGGPAGIVLGLLLARAGVEVTVLEKHGDFLRDFRGDTVHPSTLQLLDELGLGERFATLPHSRAHEITIPLDRARGTARNAARTRRSRIPSARRTRTRSSGDTGRPAGVVLPRPGRTALGDAAVEARPLTLHG
jgi:2-polyprenyl-6-methoxyphenol hydroxylase-like FAD-dependent oxidoreductase